MDEGDRPGTDRDPAEQGGESGEDGTERDEPESTESPELGEPPESAEPSESGEPPESIEPPESTESAEPPESTESIEPPERDRVPKGGDRENERTVRRRTGGDPRETEGLVYRFRHDKEGPLMWVREMLFSVAVVLAIGLILFAVSGVWPPMVAVESGSMEPNMEVGDLVFVTEPGRLAPDAADNDVGVVTYEGGRDADYRTFGSYGSVVIYRPPGRTASPIIHRAMFHVEEGENWYDRADDEYHSAAGCADLRHCPAPHDGFITLGDNNGAYDQANGLAAPVRAEWVTGVARVRVPYLGYVRLIASGQAELSDVLATTVAWSPAMDERRSIGDDSEKIRERVTVDWSGVSGGGPVANSAA